MAMMESKPSLQPSVEVTLALDLGSSSMRCLAFERTSLRQIAKASREWQPLDVHGGSQKNNYTLDDVCSLAETVVDEALDSIVSDFVVNDVAFTGFVMNLVGVDCNGDAVTTLLTYANSHAKCEEGWVAHAKSQASIVRRRTGCGDISHASYAAAQLNAISLVLDDNLKSRVKWFTTLASVLRSRWSRSTNTSVGTIGLSEAAWTGLVSLKTMNWDSLALSLLPEWCRDKLPRIGTDDNTKHSYEHIGVRTELAKRWPQIANARLHLGVADGAAANAGSACLEQDSNDMNCIAVTVGTSAAARVVLTRQALGLDSESTRWNGPPAGLWCYCLDRRRVVLGGSLSDGGSIYAWAKNTLRWDNETEAAAIALPAGVHGITVLPFLSGKERSMGWKNDVSMSLFGLTANHGPSDILRACLEAVAIRLAIVVRATIEALPAHRLGHTVRVRIVASGKALDKSPLLEQALADASGLPLFRCQSDCIDNTGDGNMNEATARGAAMLATDSVVRARNMYHQKRIDPIANNALVYQQQQRIQQQVYNKLFA